MNRIINPNAPPPRSYVDSIFDTMRVIAAYREQYLTLDAALKIDNLTATQIEELHTRQERTAIELIEFIMYGDKKSGLKFPSQARTAVIETSPARIENNAQEHAQAKA